MLRGFCSLVIVVFIGLGCQSDGVGVAEPTSASSPPRSAGGGQVLAYIGGEPLRAGELFTPLVEAGGGEILSELVLDRMLGRRLESAELQLTTEDLDAERQILLETLSDNEDEAARLLAELRQRRGWGESRFTSLLRRNAGLRKLIADRVTVTEAAVRQAYRLRHGPSSRVRLIVASTLEDIQRLRARVTSGGDSGDASGITSGGEPFGEVAALESTDASAAQGGLLSPIRPEDTSYPEAIRQAVDRLDVGEVSPPVAIDGGFALLKLEEKLPGSGVEFVNVENGLRAAVRGRAERVLMQQLARELVSGAELVVLDPMLKEQWEARRASLLSPQ
ncbi:MAG: peptidylprolyl isomerase [Planctomycetota bacterium]